MNKELNIGIVAFGGAGQAQYSHFQSIPGCKVFAIYDPHQAGLQRARQFPSLRLSPMITTNFFYRESTSSRFVRRTVLTRSTWSRVSGRENTRSVRNHWLI